LIDFYLCCFIYRTNELIYSEFGSEFRWGRSLRERCLSPSYPG